VPVLVALPRSWRSGVGSIASAGPVRAVFRVIRNPLAVWSLQAVVLWMWHIPSLYEAALNSRLVHAAEHVSFLVTAGLFWWTLFQPHGRRVLGLGTGVLFVFTSGVQSSALGALLTFAPSVVYESHQPFVAAWNISAVEDQQLAGLLMWVPAGVVYLVAALAVFAVWLRSVDAPQTSGVSVRRVLDSDARTDRSHSPRSG
jgi:putative membrane protein